jgi:hypothetical protein
MKGDNELAALVAATDADEQCQIELGEALGRLRARRDRAIRDQQAAELLPLGREVASSRLETCVSNVYKMARRHRRRFSTANAAR